MKRIIVLTLSLIVIACTPQVTVTSEVTVTSISLPTQTPIPTPTLRPEFIELQNLIANSHENLTLLPNGQIEEYGVAIPNLQVDQNGEITILVEDEKNAIDSADITFEDGFHIKGYELENGEWVEAAPSPEVLMLEEATEWKLDMNNFIQTHDVDGNPALQNNETGEIVLWSDGENNYWNLSVMREMIVESGNCKETRWEGVVGRSLPPTVDAEAFKKNFFYPLIELVRTELGKMTYPHIAYTYDFLGGENNCWATQPTQAVGQTGDDLETTVMFWKNESGRLQHERVFSPEVKQIQLAE